jgi:hypothetical protein
MIRSSLWFYSNPARRPGYCLCTALQSISAFLREYDQGFYREYRDLIK